LVIQELETRVQQLTKESEGLQNSRSKLAKEKVRAFIASTVIFANLHQIKFLIIAGCLSSVAF